MSTPELFLQLRLSRQALGDTVAWVRSLFPDKGNWRWMRKVIPGTKGEIELQGAATEESDGDNFGSVNFRVEPERRRGAHKRLAGLYFHVDKAHLDYITLTYTHGSRELYLDWIEKGNDPPETFVEFLRQGEAINRKYEADPEIDRDTMNIKNLDLFAVFAKSPLARILAPLYEETLRRLSASIEHEELHGDTSDSGYDESIQERSREDNREFFFSLKVGDHFLYNYEDSPPEEYVVVPTKHKDLRSDMNRQGLSLSTGKNAIFWYNDPKVVPVGVEHEEMHTDISGYDEGLDDDRLNEGYDPSLDLGPLCELKLPSAFADLERLYNWAEKYASAHSFNADWNSGIFADYMDFSFSEVGEPGSPAIELDFVLTFTKNELSKIEFAYYKSNARLGYVKHLVEEGTTPPRSLYDLIETAPKETLNQRTKVLEPNRFKEALSLPALKKADTFYSLFMRQLYPETEHEELHGDVGAYDEARSTWDYQATVPPEEERIDLSGIKVETLPKVGAALEQAGFIKVRWDEGISGTILWAYKEYRLAKLKLTLRIAFKPTQATRTFNQFRFREVPEHNFFSFDPSYERSKPSGAVDYQEFGELVSGIEEIPANYPLGKLPFALRKEGRAAREALLNGYSEYLKILSRFARVEHSELHSDVAGYDESVLKRLRESEEEIPSGNLTEDEIAEMLLRAEEAGITFDWGPDYEADLSWMDEEERNEVHEVECCDARNERTGQFTSLSGITDADDAYRRYVEAELAMELGVERPVHVAHEELHSDISGYDEARKKKNDYSKEDFRLFKDRSEIAGLLPGDRIYLIINPGHRLEKMFSAKVVKSMPHNGQGTVQIYVDDPRSGWAEEEKTRTYPVNSYLYYEYQPPEHEELHTDLSGYDESIDAPPLTVAELLPSSPVFEKYPWMKNVEVEINPHLDAMGQFVPGSHPGAEDALIILRDRSYIETLKHELTHLVQHTEEREHGGSSITMWAGSRRAATLKLAREIYKDMLTPRTLEDYTRAAGPFDSPEEAAKSYREYRTGLKKNKDKSWLLAQRAAGERMYRDLPSEREARGEPTTEAAGVEAERIDLSEIAEHEKGYYRLAELLTQAGFKGVAVKEVPSGGGRKDLTLRAYGETVFKDTGKQFLLYFLLAPGTFSIRPSYFDGKNKKEFVSRSIVVKNAPREIPYAYIVPRLDSDWNASYDPDEAIPEFRKLYELFLDTLTSPVAHEELHGDLGGYDESLIEGLSDRLTPEEWSRLEPGNVVVSAQGRYEILHPVPNPNPTAEIKVNFFARSNPPARNEPPEKTIFYTLGRWRLESPEHEKLHTDISGYDEARAPKRPGSTIDVNEFLTDYETAKLIEDRLKAQGYFDHPIARYASLDVSKRWDFERRDKSVFGQDWWEQGFKEVSLHLEIEQAGSRMKRIDYHGKVLRIEVMVYGKASPKELAKRGEGNYFPEHYYHRKKAVFDGKAIPENWPGPALLAASLDPEVRARVNELCAEAYAKFIEALVPSIGHEELHTDIEGYDEAIEKDKNIEEALAAFTGPEFEAERWTRAVEELKAEFSGDLFIRLDDEARVSRTFTAFTDDQSLVQFNRGSSNGNRLVQTIVSVAPLDIDMGVHLYGDEIKTGAEMPETIEALLDFHDAYYIGGPHEKARSLGKPEPGDRELVLKALKSDSGYPALRRLYEEFVTRLFPAAPEHYEVHTDTSSYDESIQNDVRMTPQEWLQLEIGQEVVWRRQSPGGEQENHYEIVSVEYNKYSKSGMRTYYSARDLSQVPDEVHVDIYYGDGDWYADIEVPEHEELHTDVGGYDESIMRSLKEAKEVLVDPHALKTAIEWARENFRSNLMFDHGPRRSLTFLLNYAEDMFTTMKTKPSASVKFQFGKLGNGEEYLNAVIIQYISPKAYSGGALQVAIIDIVEGYPIPETWEDLEVEILHKYGKAESRMLKNLRRLKFFPRVRLAFEGFIKALFAPVEHYELHGDTGSYDESKEEEPEPEPEYFPVDSGNVRIADYELLRKYGRLYGKPLPKLRAGAIEDDAPGGTKD